MLLKNGLYNALASIIRILLGILTIPALIGIIGVKEYGLWTLVSSIVSLVTLSEGGLATATTVFIAQDLAKDDKVELSNTLTSTVGFILLLSTIALAATQLLAHYIPPFFYELTLEESSTFRRALQISGIVSWARIVQQVMIGIEQAYQKYALINYLATIQSVLMTLGLLIVAHFGGRSIAMMQYQALACVVLLFLHILLCSNLLKYQHIRLSFNRSKASSIIRYSLSTWFTNLGGTIFSQSDKLFVGSTLGSSSLGVYAAVTGVATQINSFSSLLLQPIFPALVIRIASSENLSESVWPSVEKALRINCLVSLGLGCILLHFSSLIMSWMIPSNIYNSSILMKIGVIIYSLYSLNSTGYFVCLSANLLRRSMQIVLGSGIFSLFLIAVFSRFYGLTGAMLGNSGYLATIALDFVAGAYLGISLLEVFKVIYIPSLIFLVFGLSSFLLENFIFVKDIFFIASIICMIFWFCSSQSISPKSLAQVFK